MAIYRTGQASMDADGYITGYGTKWKTALTLIRPGATIVFASNPVAYATISEIVNDTSLRATSTGGAVVPRGDYVILLHDSITVDGLAQDVAETLRYYQGQETMYQEFVEFLKGFDWQKLEEMERNTEANAAAAGASARAAAQSESNANASKNAAAASATTSSQQASAAASSASAAKESENNAASSKAAAANSASAAATSATTAGQHKDAAAASASAAKTSETNASASKTAAASSASAAKTSETNAKSSETNAASSASAANTAKNEAQTAASSANASKSAAANSATAAAGSATTAKNEADRAAELAKQLDATNLMRKDANLSDVVNKALGRQNLGAIGIGDFGIGNSNGIPRISSLKDVTACGVYTMFGDGTSTPTTGAPEGSGNNILTLIVSPIYSNAWALLAYTGGGVGAWVGRFNPQDSTPAPVWTKFANEGGAPEFGAVYARNGIEVRTFSDNTNPAASLVSRRGTASGSTIVSSEMRANADGSVEWIKRDSAGTPRSIQISSDNEVKFNSLVPVPSQIEVGKANPNTTAYIDFHYGAKYDYDARIMCDGYNSDQAGGGNLRFRAGYTDFASSGGYVYSGGRATFNNSDINMNCPVSVTSNGNALSIRPSTNNNPAYIMFKNLDNTNWGYVGCPGAQTSYMRMHDYRANKYISLESEIILGGGDTKTTGSLKVDGSSVYVRGGSGTNNTHLWLQNSSGRNRAVIYSSDTQVLQLRSDNASTGAGGQALSVYGSTGECKAVKFTATSDERAKFWIKPVTGALDKVCSLRGVTYSMHTTIQDTVRNAGVIAQDVQKVLPEAVSVGETGSTLDKDCFQVENPLSLDYNALSALYVEAFKEMRGLIEEQRAEIESLKSTVASLQASTLI